ncbi:MAG: hypothetical protein ACFFEM_01115, partial [Candidatus Thorarchaeota archaeon]
PWPMAFGSFAARLVSSPNSAFCVSVTSSLRADQVSPLLEISLHVITLTAQQRHHFPEASKNTE